MGTLAFILGRSGTGKSHSMKNFKPGEIGVVNVVGKPLPFKGSGAIETVTTDNSAEIITAIESLAKKYKTVVVDDFQYVMANEFMRRSAERGYDKFTEIARHAWDIADVVRRLPADVIVYIMCHTDTDADGVEKLKTIGKLLDEKIVLEGMSTIVLKTAVSDGQYMFLTQNNGHDTVKSPAGMFPTYAIDNDLKYVDEKIRSYYEIGEHKTDAEMQSADAEAAKDAPETKKRGRRGKKEEEKPAETSIEETEEKATSRAREAFEKARAEFVTEEVPKRRSRRRTLGEEIANAGLVEARGADEVPFDAVEVPQRKDRTESEELPINAPQSEEQPVRRRRRRRGAEE